MIALLAGEDVFFGVGTEGFFFGRGGTDGFLLGRVGGAVFFGRGTGSLLLVSGTGSSCCGLRTCDSSGFSCI